MNVLVVQVLPPTPGVGRVAPTPQTRGKNRRIEGRGTPVRLTAEPPPLRREPVAAGHPLGMTTTPVGAFTHWLQAHACSHEVQPYSSGSALSNGLPPRVERAGEELFMLVRTPIGAPLPSCFAGLPTSPGYPGSRPAAFAKSLSDERVSGSRGSRSPQEAPTGWSRSQRLPRWSSPGRRSRSWHRRRCVPLRWARPGCCGSGGCPYQPG
jgi:hypothetical protein